MESVVSDVAQPGVHVHFRFLLFIAWGSIAFMVLLWRRRGMESFLPVVLGGAMFGAWFVLFKGMAFGLEVVAPSKWSAEVSGFVLSVLIVMLFGLLAFSPRGGEPRGHSYDVVVLPGMEAQPVHVVRLPDAHTAQPRQPAMSLAVERSVPKGASEDEPMSADELRLMYRALWWESVESLRASVEENLAAAEAERRARRRIRRRGTVVKLPVNETPAPAQGIAAATSA